MAVVKEFKAPNGVTVRIHDDAYAGCSREEILARQKRAAREIYRIAERIYDRLPPEEREDFLRRIAAPEDALPPDVWIG